MRALGKGSIAEIIRVGLLVAWIVLWALVVAVGATALLSLLRASSVLDPRFAAELFEPSVANPAGLAWPIAAPAFLVGLVALSAGLIIVSRLRRLYLRFSQGDPFNSENLGHLRAIWITMLAVELFRMAVSAIAGLIQRGTLSLSFDFFTWAAIIVLIAVSEIFREGARMKAEQELTI